MKNINKKEINELASRIEVGKITEEDIELIESIPKFDGTPESLILRLNELYQSI